MDQLTPFQVFLLERLDFAPNSFEVYQGERLINRGHTSMKIKVMTNNKSIVCQDNIRITIEDNNLSNILNSTAFFDVVMTLHDRVITLISSLSERIADL